MKIVDGQTLREEFFDKVSFGGVLFDGVPLEYPGVLEITPNKFVP